MILNDFSDIFQSKLRLMIISALTTGQKTFKELKEITGATDGNISVQISNLESANFVSVIKLYIGKKPQTRIGLTEYGLQQFIEYVNMLNSVLSNTNISNLDDNNSEK